MSDADIKQARRNLERAQQNAVIHATRPSATSAYPLCRVPVGGGCAMSTKDPAKVTCPKCLDLLGEMETTLPPMPIKDDTKKALRTAGRKVQEWTEERDRLVRQAVQEGGSLREVGDLAGVSHTAVRFIAHGRPPR